MKYKTPGRLAPEERARRGASALAKLAGWTFVLVMPGMTTTGAATVYFSVIGWAKGEMCRHDELRLWSLNEHSFWLLQDPDGESPDGPGFDLASGQLRPTTDRPWRNEHEHGFGFGRADSVLSSMGAL